MEICFSAACLTHLGKKHFAASFDEVPADLVEHRHMVNSISGAPTRSQIQSPGLQRERYNNENRGRNRTQGKEQGRRDSSQGKRNSRNSSSTRLCYNWDKKKKHILRPLAQNPRKKKEKLKEGQLPLTQGVETLQETDVEVVREVTHTLRFILPCKSECQPIYQN